MLLDDLGQIRDTVMVRRISKAVLLGAALQLSSTQGMAQDLELSVPLRCTLGSDCFVQNYVDIDPSESVRAVDCGQASYDGHKGTDFRVLNTEVVADVLVAAPGKVRALRDDMPDRLVRSQEDRQAVRNKECGNGVVVDHGEGWETQYCHLRQGSVSVAVGDELERGQVIGQVGYSGLAAFPHVHLSVRQNGETVDPFLGTVEKTRLAAQACAAGPGSLAADGQDLWQEPRDLLLEDAGGALIETGLAGRPLGTLELETARATPAASQAPALLFYARLINLKRGDRVALKLTGPDGLVAESEGQPLDKNKAQWVAYAGRKTRGSWPAGTYTGEVMLLRGGEEILRETADYQLTD